MHSGKRQVASPLRRAVGKQQAEGTQRGRDSFAVCPGSRGTRRMQHEQQDVSCAPASADVLVCAVYERTAISAGDRVREKSGDRDDIYFTSTALERGASARPPRARAPSSRCLVFSNVFSNMFSNRANEPPRDTRASRVFCFLVICICRYGGRQPIANQGHPHIPTLHTHTTQYSSPSYPFHPHRMCRHCIR